MRIWKRGGTMCLVALMLAIVPGAAVAQDAAPQATQVLRQMADFLAAAKHFSFHAETNFDDNSHRWQKMQVAGAGDVTVSRPNKVFADFRDDLSGRTFWYDRDKITILDPGANFYAVEEVPDEIDTMLDDIENRFDLRLPLGELISNGPYEALAKGIQRSSYFGIHDVDGTACHHLGFVMENIDVQLWVELGDKPLPRKIVIDYRDEARSPQYMAVLMDWDFSKPDKNEFTPQIPENAKRIQFLPRNRAAGEATQ